MVSSSQIIILLAVAALHLSAAPSQASSRLLSADPCKETLYRKLCRSFLTSGNFQSRTNLTVAMINQTMTKLKSASERAEKLSAAAEAAKDKVREMYLHACKSDYDSAYRHLEKGSELIRGSGTNKQIKYYLSWAWSSIGTCRAEWKETHIVDFPLEHVDALLNKLGQSIYDLGLGLGTKDIEDVSMN